MDKNKGGPYKKFLKRPMDVLLSAGALVVLGLPMLIVAILVKTKMGSPVLFKQPRPGLNEEIFNLYKFRTMTNKKDDNGELLPDVERLTKFGEMLRATSLDELPGLLNVLKGDISIVGPRPLSTNYLPYYSETERKRHSVRPGVTGLAQVNGRNSLSWEEKFEFDLQYIEMITFALDFSIIIKTVVKVIKRADIGQGEEAPVSLHIARNKNSKRKG